MSGWWEKPRWKMQAGRWWWWTWNEERVKVEGQMREEGFFCRRRRRGNKHSSESTHMNSGLRLPAPVFSAKWLPFGFLTISLHGQSRGAPRHPLPCHDLEAPGWWSSCPRGRVTSGPDTDCGFSPTRAAVHGWTKKREDSRRGASSCGTPGSALGCDFEWEPGAHQEVEFKRETPGCGALAVAGR